MTKAPRLTLASLDRKMDLIAAELRLEIKASEEKGRRHRDVLFESLKGQIQTLADGVAMLSERVEMLGEKVDDYNQESVARDDQIMALVRASYADLEGRVRRVEGRSEV